MSHENTDGNNENPQQEDEPPPAADPGRKSSVSAVFRPKGQDCGASRTAVQESPLKSIRFPQSSRTQIFRKRYFPSASPSDWNNWYWQIQNTLRSVEDVNRVVNLTLDEREAMTAGHGGLPTAITPYYASLIDPTNPGDPIRRTMIPTGGELLESPGEAKDPLGEDEQSPTPGLIHRYPDRVLFMATEYCSAYCRYCTRSRLVGDSERKRYSCTQWEMAIGYIKSHPEIRDVIVSGGDPLTLPDEPLEWLLMNLRAIPHVEVIRIGTKVPAVLPMRVTSSLTRILRRCHPLWMSLHFTHPDELTPETAEACSRLADAGCPLGSQTVLLKGINDDADTMRRLMTGLMRIRVRPYYLYQCDPILGSDHFRTPVAKGLEMIKALRGFVSGYAVPQYVIDAPGGGGKIPLLPEYVVAKRDGDVEMRNFRNHIYHYPDTAK